MTAENQPLGDPPVGEAVSTFPASRPRRLRRNGQYVNLAPLSLMRHGNTLWESTHSKDKERLWCYLAEGPFAERAAFDAFLVRKTSSEDPLFFAVMDQSGQAVGFESLMRIEPVHRCIEIGNILLSPALQRTPGGTEAIFLLLEYAFEDLGYRRIEWKCDALNAPSRRAALRYGFTFEGIFRKHMVVKGRNRDTAWFSMLEGEWRQYRAAFERWLNPNNFDPDGKQRFSLAALRAQ
jgi:RimJ/RimL family protein N-acetyltransferase